MAQITDYNVYGKGKTHMAIYAIGLNKTPCTNSYTLCKYIALYELIFWGQFG